MVAAVWDNNDELRFILYYLGTSNGEYYNFFFF